MTKFKPHFFPGEHGLWADIINMSSPLRNFKKMALYDHVVMGLEVLNANLTMQINYNNTAALVGFLDRCQTKWDLSARVADMFTRPGGVIIH